MPNEVDWTPNDNIFRDRTISDFEKITVAIAKLESLKSRIASLESVINRKDLEVGLLKEEVKAKDDYIKHLQTKLATANPSVNDDQRFADLRRENKKLKDAIFEIRRNNSDLVAKYQQIRMQVEKLDTPPVDKVVIKNDVSRKPSIMNLIRKYL